MKKKNSIRKIFPSSRGKITSIPAVRGKKTSSIAKLPLFGGIYINKDFLVYYIYICTIYLIINMCTGIEHDVVFVLLWNII